MNQILRAYNLNNEGYSVSPFGNGLINKTWKVTASNSNKSFVLQRLNTSVFSNPQDIAANIRYIADFLSVNCPEYLFITPIKTVAGDEMFFDEGNSYYRLFPFLHDSQSFDVVTSPDIAYEAARQFALFTKSLSGFNTGILRTTLADFHNLSLRFSQYKEALVKGNPSRIKQAWDLISFLNKQSEIIDTFEVICMHSGFKLRVMHHDTKISNVLFNQENKGLCIIDLDTVMPGYFISDVGDMLRTYLSPANEEEADFEKIDIRKSFFEAIVDGYLSEMGEILTQAEKLVFLFSGKFMIYMQALRFLTDHLNNDIYYGAKYEDHNLIRARNQAILLQKLLDNEQELNNIIVSKTSYFSFPS